MYKLAVIYHFMEEKKKKKTLALITLFSVQIVIPLYLISDNRACWLYQCK